MNISVIIPAYKARKFLPDCLESIGRQTLAAAEVLVIDDASPEPIDDIVKSFATIVGYPQIRLLKHEVNRGQAAGRNTGMNAASGDWLAFIDCDDIWASNHLESVFKSVQHANADLGFCPAILFKENPYRTDNFCLGPENEDEKLMRPLSFLNRCFIITSSTIIKKKSLIQIGGFDESPGLRGVEDLDCFLRLLKDGAGFTMASQPTLYYRKHSGSATGTVGYLARQDITVKTKHMEWVDGHPSDKRRIISESYWRAAMQLWSAQAPDRFLWVLKAILHSFWNPYFLLKNLVKIAQKSLHIVRNPVV